jgi:alpha-ribazole phosphatase
MTALVLVRHTKPNVEPGVCYGRLDVPLAPTWQQDVADCLEGIPAVLAVISSPLSRCRVLAEAAAARDGLEVQYDLRLQELDFGTWEGRRWDEIARKDIDAWALDPLEYRPGGGESLRVVWDRVVPAYEDCKRAACERVLVVTHLGPLRVLLAHRGALQSACALSINVAWGHARPVACGACHE